MASKRHPRSKRPQPAPKKFSAGVVAARDRRILFAKEYLIDQNGTQAAIRVGYQPKGAHAQASVLLKHPEVRAILDAATASAVKKLDIDRDTILQELAHLAFSNALHYGRITEDGHYELDLKQATFGQIGAVQELITKSRTIGTGKHAVLERTTKLKLSNKREALVDLGKAIGLFQDDPSAGQPAQFIIQNLYVNGEPHGRAQDQPKRPGERPGEEYVDPARTTAHLRRL